MNSRAAITRNAGQRIHQPERGGGNDSLLQGALGKTPGKIEKAVRVTAISERPAREARPATGVTNERKLESVRRQVGQTVDAVGSEVMILALFAVGDHRRTGRFEARDRVADRFFVERIEHRIGAVCGGKRFNQTQRPGNAANRLSWNDHGLGGRSRVEHKAPATGGKPVPRPRLPAIRLPLAQASLGCHLPLRSRAEVAQLVEQLIRNQQVTGSSPVFGSLYNQGLTPTLADPAKSCLPSACHFPGGRSAFILHGAALKAVPNRRRSLETPGRRRIAS